MFSNQDAIAVVARPTGFENVKTGKVTKSATPLVDAARAARALVLAGAPVAAIGVEGAHPYGLAFGAKATQKNSVPGDWIGELAFVGLTPDALIGNVLFTQQLGVPGETAFHSLTLQSQSFIDSKGKPATNPFCLLTAQKQLAMNGGITVEDCVYLSHSIEGYPDADTGNRVHGYARYFRSRRNRFKGFNEHGNYIGNVQSESWSEDSQFEGCRRTGDQWVNRYWELVDKKTGKLTEPTLSPSTPASCVIRLRRNTYLDCSSYWDAALDTWVANGSAISLSGCPGRVDVISNVVLQTHPGGGALVAYLDAKNGPYRTPEGRAIGRLVLARNSFQGEVTPAKAVAERSLVAIGGCDVVELHPNFFQADEIALVLDHVTKNGRVEFVGYKEAFPPSHARFWKAPAGKAAIEVNGKPTKIGDAQLDALMV